jgi:8-oxo-dGTP pyrophosphatase MutT (NUDIX family)
MRPPSWEPRPEADQTLESNWLFQLRRRRYESRGSGKTHDFYVMELADAAHVVAITPENQVVLVRQFRAGSGHDSLEPPGGLLEPGEDPCLAGARELLEETGYAGDPPRLLGSAWSNPSILSSRIFTVLVTNARPVSDRSLDHHEEVEVELVPAGRLPSMIRDGRIDHALAVLALFQWLCSQLPDTPFALETRTPRQYHIGALMLGIAGAALLFGVLKGLGTSPSCTWGLVVSVPLGAYLVFRVLDPPSHAILLRGHNRSIGRVFIRLLAAAGLVTGLYLVVVLAWLGLRGGRF